LAADVEGLAGPIVPDLERGRSARPLRPPHAAPHVMPRFSIPLGQTADHLVAGATEEAATVEGFAGAVVPGGNAADDARAILPTDALAEG
jgi:hypothetical protein